MGVKLTSVECFKDRAVCTVSSLATDELWLACALGGSGNIELWNRRSLEKAWLAHAHEEGAYSIGRFLCHDSTNKKFIFYKQFFAAIRPL